MAKINRHGRIRRHSAIKNKLTTFLDTYPPRYSMQDYLPQQPQLQVRNMDKKFATRGRKDVEKSATTSNNGRKMKEASTEQEVTG